MTYRPTHAEKATHLVISDESLKTQVKHLPGPWTLIISVPGRK